jgi:molybdopterin-guanine dinucleotide biosynthesis adapter protein
MNVVGFAGYSGNGKTTLIEAVIPLLVGRGLRVSLIKHAHHRFDVDQPGKDSYRHRAAGAAEVLVSSQQRWVLMHELREESEPSLDEHLKRLSPCDVVLVEGFKRAPIAKIEVHRAAAATPLLFPDDPHIIAIATDEALETRIPQLNINDAAEIADFICGIIEKVAVPLSKKLFSQS